jgi:hypothetical protein
MLLQSPSKCFHRKRWEVQRRGFFEAEFCPAAAAAALCAHAQKFDSAAAVCIPAEAAVTWRGRIAAATTTTLQH